MGGRGWITTQIGAREHYLAPVALARKKLLHTCFTDIWAGSFLSRCLGQIPSFRGIAGRYEERLETERVVAFNLAASVEGCRLLLHPPGNKYLQYLEYGAWFSKRVANTVAKWNVDPAHHVYFGFNTGCLETIKMLKERGVFSVVQQIDPARVEEQIVLEEMRRWPGWTANPEKIPDIYFERLQKEWEVSSMVVVNSEWTRLALIKQGVPDSKLAVIPLAYEPAQWDCSPNRCYSGRPLKALWFGSVNLRKGFPYFLEAARNPITRGVQFVVAGPVSISSEAASTAPPNVHFLGRIHRSEMPNVMARADAYVLPTISDGFALTQLEAMAYGLPVITTSHCGDVVTHRKDGFIVPVRDGAAIADAIAELDDDRKLLEQMSNEALNTVRRFSINRFGDRLVGEVGKRR